MNSIEEALINTTNDVIFGIDLSGKIIYVNQAASKLYDYTKKEFLGKKFNTLFSNRKKEEFSNILEKILFEESIEPAESIRLTKAGTTIKVIASYSPIKDRGGKVIGISSIEGKISEYLKIERKAKALIEFAPDAIIIVNQLGQIILVNRETEQLFGYKRKELLGQEIELLIPKEFHTIHYEHRKHYYAHPEVKKMRLGRFLYGKKKNGKTFPVDINLSPLKTEEGLFVMADIRDNSELKKSEEKFRKLLESAPDAMVIINPNGNIQIANKQTEKLFGFSKGELVGKKIEILVPVGIKKKYLKFRELDLTDSSTTLITPVIVGREKTLYGIKKGGEKFPIEVSLSPLKIEDSLLISIATRDISERQYMKELELKNQELEQFAYIASHDLQEPLRTISGVVDLLNLEYKGRLDEEADKYLSFISASTDRMTKLIKALLGYSRIGKEKVYEKVDCNEISQQVTSDLDVLIKETKAKIHISKLPIVNALPNELKQLFQNLISNAIKFRKKDTPPQINISAQKMEEEWGFQVKDNGIGIDEKYMGKIFTIFQRLHSRSEYEGEGIGLAVCKKIVELHNGKIWVKSKPGEGSIFYFTLKKEQ
ncbi:PAS domain-containing sensor histidine kinase [Xanthovirga aplysinae]|uniref:PAS domain-containing sensor histidine kinase n=1 Tax=Xanthovirga aplysinae TaxID=2529853 RepID=UPI0012BB68BD|nr:PAS domain S-box protein [Xanthovirga aplysinae]MTI33513.1 PAS domain S-box protein [Xanthovirga aplysinae]